MAMISGRTLASVEGGHPRVASTGCRGFRPWKGLFPLRLQRFNRLGLCNPLGENQPSLSRRFKLFAMSPVAYSLSHFAVGDCQAFGRSQYLPVQPLTDQRALCRRAISHRTRSLGGIIGVTDTIG